MVHCLINLFLYKYKTDYFYDFLLPPPNIQSTPAFVVSYTSAVAINTVEYVPVVTPIIRAKVNPLIDSPQKINITIRTNKTVREVFIVRLIVAFTAKLIISALSRLR